MIPLRAAPNASSNAAIGRRRIASRRARPFNSSQSISENLFRDALERERKRADRFGEAFVVLLVSLDRRELSPSSLTSILEALTRLRPGGDVIGWFEHDSILGLIRSVDPRAPGAAAASLANVFGIELARCLTAEQAACCSVRCEAYSPRSEAVPFIFDSGSRRARLGQVAGAAAKRLLDVVGSAFGLIVLAPVFVSVAAIVKLTSKGPAFFRQQRVGEAGRPFMMFKFRTMQVNCDPKIHQQYVEGFIQSGAPATSGKDAVFKIVNDPRVTPVGDFLRRSSLDELPQLWNVLRGEMSLVGPRPPLPYEVARYKHWHKRRVLEAKPGMTGLWQVAGRSRTTFDDMVRLDLRYAAKSSVWTDVKILAATPRAVLSGRGAR